MGFGGGGSAGGGGSSGTVDYQTYQKEVHEDWLRQVADTIDESVTDVMNSALGSSPFLMADAYDPSTEVAAILAAPGGLEALVDLLSSGTGLDILISSILDESRITDSVTAFNTDLGVKADAEIYPRFEAGMRDINAVMSSAFVIGRANIAEQIVREVGKYEGELRYKAFGDDAIRVINMKLDYEKAVNHLKMEANRISIVANKEQVDTDIKYDEADATWDLEVFQYGANVLASIAGGVAQPKGPKQPSTAQSMIGGALSGVAAAGMMGMGPPGMIAGGVLGLASGLLN